MNNAVRTTGFLCCVLSMALCTAALGAQKSTVQEPPPDKSAACPVVTEATEHTCPCLCRECERRWRMIVTPYGWCVSLKGSMLVKDTTTEFDVGFGKILDNLDYAVMGQVELTNGRWMLLSDSFLSKIGASVSVDKSVNVLFGDDNLFLGVDANLEMKLLIQEFMAGYRLYEKCLQQADACGLERKLALDLLFGARYYEIDAKVDAEAELRAEGPGGGQVRRKRSASRSGSVDWTDAVVGGRLSYDLTRSLALSLRGDVGGFHGKEDSSWSASALAQWRIRKHLTLIGGYKVENFKYAVGDGGMDVTLKGPIAALAWKWEF